MWHLGLDAIVAPVYELESRRRVVSCALSPDGARVAAVLENGFTQVLDLATGRGDEEFPPGASDACAFTDDGRLLLTAGVDGLQALDAVAGLLRGEPTGGDGGRLSLTAGPGGLASTTDRSGTTLGSPSPPSRCSPAVSPDTVDGTDLLGVTADAAALADVIAAKSTARRCRSASSPTGARASRS